MQASLVPGRWQTKIMSSCDDSKAVGLSSSLDSEVGRVVIDLGLATQKEVDFCREQMKQASDVNQRSLGDLLLENNFITVNQAKRIRRQLTDEKTHASQSQIPGYVILGKLGKGAMATVFKARQTSLNRIVAIKVMPRKMGENVEFVERFYKEGQAAARLSHNNIVQAIDVGCSPDGLHFFVMEFIEGHTLYDIMQPPPVGKGSTFSEAEALDIGIQMADALAHAHERGLIHRDVKPKNIILTPQGVAKLTDLGLARVTDDKAAAAAEVGKAYGTPYYISPEQIRGELEIDFRTDIYSLGATLYHLLTGRPPFDGDSPSAVMHKHLKQALVPVDHVNTSLSAGIGEIIEVAMAKKRDERYQSTREMLEDLKAVQRGEAPVHARRAFDVSQLSQIEETGKTIDIAIGPRFSPAEIWRQPPVIFLVCGAAVSVILNLILFFMYLSKH